MNEVNYLAFSESNEEYHNELYGFIEREGRLNDYKNGKPTMNYRRMRNEQEIEEQKVLSEFIRHQIHHPGNTLNKRFTIEQLQESIGMMREFIQNNM